MQSPIHEGYEYQDYFTVSIILQLMLKQTDAEIIIDRKDFSGDKFDDLKVKTPNGTTEFQIKYSDDEYSHKLAKDDFANGNGHDTALCDLFASWKTRKESENDTQIKLCLAWNRPDDDDPIVEFLKPIQEQALPFSIVAYSFDGEVFWPVGNLPPKTWRKFNLAVKSGLIDREAFLSFCNELTIILEMPKASLDLKNPGGIENVIIRQAEKLGVGIYPNDNLNLEEVIYKLATEVKRSRAMGNRLYINTLMGRLGFIRDYGKFDQRFPVDSAHKVMLDDEIESLHRAIRDSKRVIITGNPGSGKSWLVDEYIDKLENDDSKVIHYNCFQSLQDTNSLERIRVTSLYGNLVSQIVEQYPELVEHKNTTLGADKAELENLLRLIGGEFYLVVDGLDHISREYDLHKDLISRSETEIISELLEIHFPDNCYVTIASQPIDALDEFKANSYCIFKIEPWGIKQVKSLMATFQIADDTIKGDDSSISEYLLKKSQGNALYLNYILRQLRNSNVNKELIDGIPDYDISLSEYYSYLYKKIHNNRTVNALCGADFYLSLNDLMEITGDGEFVEQDISMLHPLLAENVLSGGFSIYHESFRRFVLSSLENRKVDIEKNVYGILTDWLQEKPFFKFDKSFYYLSELLYKIKKDAENIALIDKKFVLNAVAEGYSRKRIRMNLNCIIRSAARIRNLVALITASELLAMLDDMNEFESTGEEYFQALCDIKGASKLNQLMQIDGKPSFDMNTGKIACYISSKAGITPWWKLYLDIEAKQYKIEELKYYYRYYLDEQGVSLISKYNQTEALECFDISTRYLVAYGYHKDIILLQIMDSYNVFFESVSGNPEEERDTITKMTIALWNHTDGRETKHFLNRWFDKLLKTDSRHALAFLFELQIKFGKSWVVEGMLRSAIEKYCNDLGFLDIVIGLIESLPNDTSPRIIDASTSIFRTLEQMCTGADVDERLLIKSRMKEFVINIVSRYNILDNPWPDNDSWKDGSIKEFLLTVEAAGFDVSQYIEYFHIKKTNDMENKEDKKTIDVFEATQTCFEALTPEDAKKWFETHDLIERDVQDICEFLKNYQNDKGTLLELLRFIITKSGGWSYSQKRKDIILQIIGRLELDDEEMSEVHMLMYLYSYEWGSSLIDKDEFLNSIRLSSDVGRNTFYSELPEVIISHSGRITKGLLDALFAFEYDKDIIVEIWRNVFDIMKLRFPNLDQYTSDNIFEETDELLELRNCLLMRFIDGGKESFLATYAYLANAAEKEKFSEFTESIVFCLEHYEQYNLVTQIAIADLVRCYGWCLKDMNIDRMISAINVVYPTGNLLLDVIFSEFTVYNSYLLMCSDKHAPDYMEQEDVEFYLAEQLYDLGKEEVQEGTDEYAENSVYRDPIMQVLDTSGINYIEIYKKLHASRRLNDKMQDFVGGASKILETNTVYKSYVIQYALHAIIEKAFIDREPELLPQTLFRLIPDYQGMYKLFKCRDMQPQNHLYDKNNSCEPFLINNKDEYILIGCSEIKKHIDYHQTSLIFAYQGIVGEAGDEHQIPFQQYLATAVEEGEIYTILDNPESLIDFIRTLDRELEDEDYLWPGTSVSKLLDVHIEFDFLNGRYIAINQEKDVVFIMKKWSSSYKGDSEYHGNAIPLYSGTKLYIKKEYIGILEQQFGTLMMKTCVQSYTQDY